MYKKFKKHLAYYISLLAILFFGLVLTFLATPNIKLQSVIVSLTISFYVLWGILHHMINHELTPRIMIEYILIGALGISILFFMLMGGII